MLAPVKVDFSKLESLGGTSVISTLNLDLARVALLCKIAEIIKFDFKAFLSFLDYFYYQNKMNAKLKGL